MKYIYPPKNRKYPKMNDFLAKKHKNDDLVTFKKTFSKHHTQNKKITVRYWSSEAIRAIKIEICYFPGVLRSILVQYSAFTFDCIRENRKIRQNRGIYFRPVGYRCLGPKTSKKRRCVQKMGYLANSCAENEPFQYFTLARWVNLVPLWEVILHWKTEIKIWRWDFANFGWNGLGTS